MTMNTRRRAFGSGSTLIAGLVLLVLLLAVSASSAAPARRFALDPRDKVDPQVLAAAANGQMAEFIVVMAEQADVSAAYRLLTKQAKGRYVFGTLSGLAERTQAGIRAYLDQQGISYKSFYSINALYAVGGQELVLALAARPDVGRRPAR
jgi:hypothetical protein